MRQRKLIWHRDCAICDNFNHADWKCKQMAFKPSTDKNTNQCRYYKSLGIKAAE